MFYLLHLVNDSLECIGIVNSEVSEDLAVDLDTSLVKSAHQLLVAHTLETCSSIDTLNPECTESALLVLAVAICIGETFLPSVLGNGPNVLTCAKVAACKLKYSLSLCS